MDEAIRALAEEMARHGTDRDAPVRSVMALLGDRWTTLILLVLATGEMRHAELKRVLATLSAEQAISQRVLTLKLRALERDGFVSRSVTADIPPRVSYRLTALGQALHNQARSTIDWVKSVSGEIGAARDRFDRN
ncbi:MAG: winged helix-turn-helix transcriptional regulator [Novosphingobium sp.]